MIGRLIAFTLVSLGTSSWFWASLFPFLRLTPKSEVKVKGQGQISGVKQSILEAWLAESSKE